MKNPTPDEIEEVRRFFKGRRSREEWEHGLRYYSLPPSTRRLLRVMAAWLYVATMSGRRR